MSTSNPSGKDSYCLQPMETAPLDGTFILLFGDSGYVTNPLRCQVCRYYPEYRPRQPWVTFDNSSFLDDGSPPIGWMPLPAYDPAMLQYPREFKQKFETVTHRHPSDQGNSEHGERE